MSLNLSTNDILMSQRRHFIKNSFAATAAALVSPSIFSQSKKRRAPATDNPAAGDKPIHLNYATHDGMFKNSGGNDFIDQIKFAYDMGFRSIEDNGMMGRTPEMQS